MEIAERQASDFARRTRIVQFRREADLELLKKGIWLYFFLLIFEGALRKWVLPGLATPLLIVRDPVAIWLLVKAWQIDRLQPNLYISSIYLITGIAIITALTFGHGSLTVALYGARIFLFHFPLMFVIGNVFTRDDIVALGKVTLWISLPMVVLIALQFYSPQSAFVNRGVGGDIQGGGFSGALGFFRPPGTFSFTTGTTQFFCLVGIFVIYFWLNPNSINRLLLIASSFAFLAAIPLSISRGLLIQTMLSLAFVAISISRKPKYLGRMFLAGIGLFVIVILLNQIAFFKEATVALTTRFDDAGENEGGLQGTLGDRFLGGLLGAITSSSQTFWGLGIGMGTNAGAKLLTGNADFLIAEEDWGRLIGEMGTILGLGVIVIRVRFCALLAVRAYKKLIQGDLLPWILISLSVVTVGQSQWAQPTTLGFSTILGGITLASFNISENSRTKN